MDVLKKHLYMGKSCSMIGVIMIDINKIDKMHREL